MQVLLRAASRRTGHDGFPIIRLSSDRCVSGMGAHAGHPALRGWAAYYRTVVSKQVFAQIDHTLVWTMLKWGRHRHETKSYRWIMNRYFGRFHPARQDRWLFGDRDTGACLTRLSWTPIRRHQMVNADASPDDPALAYYWRQRRRRRLPPDTPTAPAPAPYTLRRPQGLA